MCHLIEKVCTSSNVSCLAVAVFFRTLVIGGAGSLMLDLYGWESVFYVSGLLSVLWAYCMWKYLLKGEGKGGFYIVNNNCRAAECSYLIAAYLNNWSLLFADLTVVCLCLQGLSSHWSPWEAGPSPSCLKDIGSGS